MLINNFRPPFDVKLSRKSIILTGLTYPHVDACSKTGTGFLMTYTLVFFVVIDLMWEVVVRFVDIGRGVDDHCLNFLINLIIYFFNFTFLLKEEKQHE